VEKEAKEEQQLKAKLQTLDKVEHEEQEKYKKQQQELNQQE